MKRLQLFVYKKFWFFRQVLLYEPQVTKPSEFTEDTLFKINHDFAILKNGKLQKRGKINLIGRLQLSTEKARKEENESIMQLRILRTQEAIIKILKMRKVSTHCSKYRFLLSQFLNILKIIICLLLQRISNAQLQTELVDILKNMFLPSKKMIKEQIEWLIEHKYMKRDEDNINMFIYMA